MRGRGSVARHQEYFRCPKPVTKGYVDGLVSSCSIIFRIRNCPTTLRVEGCQVGRQDLQHADPMMAFLRKEVIQPQVPLRLPCYDFTPVAELTVAGCPLVKGRRTVFG
jgi:hypothetical protein